MAEDGISSLWVCRQCGRENRPPEPRCWFCSAPRPGATEIATTPAPARRAPAETDDDYPKPLSWSSFHRRLPAATAYAVISLSAVLVLAYGVGVAMLILLAPVLHRLFRMDQERAQSFLSWRSDRTAGQTFAVIAAAIGIALLVVVSSLITFTAVCFPTGGYAIVNLGPEGLAIQIVVWTAGMLGGMVLAGGLGYAIIAAIFRSPKQFDPRVPPPGVDRPS